MPSRTSAPAPARRLLAALLLAAAGLLTLAPSALAHDALVSTDPADGAMLDVGPSTVTLTFSGDIQQIGTAAEVDGPDGPVSTGAPEVRGREVSVALTSAAAAGDYRLLYRATSSDGHPVSGSVAFSVRPAGSTAAAPSGTPTAGAASAAPTTPTPTTTAPTPTMTATPAPSATAAPGTGGGPPTTGDVTGTDLVVPIVGVVAAALIVGGILFARAAVNRREEERRL